MHATVQAYFRLQKPVSLLIPRMARLEYDIYGEIGVPSTKVAILSMHRAGVSDWTNVVVGVLSDPWNVSINSVSLSVLRSSLIELFLGHSNLTLTASIFGQPSSFEILKFPGGITVIPEQYASIWQIPQILFNFTLYNSINEIKENFVELKQQLKFGLYLRPNENVYVQVTNNYGSTKDPPVTVQASVMSDLGNLQPQRLKQLAQTITGSPSAENLGLNNSVFGKVKQISLSSYLNQTIHGSPPIPSPAPSPSPDAERPISPSKSLSPSNYPAPLPDFRRYPPCFNCDASSPSDDSHPSAPSPGNDVHHSLPPISSSPAPSMVNTPFPRSRGCRIPPNPSPKSHPVPVAPAFSPRTSIYPPPIGPTPQMSPGLSPLPVVSYGSSRNQDKGNWEGVSPPSASPSVSASLSLNEHVIAFVDMDMERLGVGGNGSGGKGLLALSGLG
ncbi:unnamed protein product [Ilex paraguariensis]|uniref:DUF7036 domain-containing protein n=1 Tax=Ilex paraguariensis TaxID=185542 RepID=A0ABC8S1W2_9AQUA